MTVTVSSVVNGGCQLNNVRLCLIQIKKDGTILWAYLVAYDKIVHWTVENHALMGLIGRIRFQASWSEGSFFDVTMT